MNFGSWNNSIHTSAEQLKRIASAKKADTSPASVDTQTQTAFFQGSGKSPYRTTLNDCSCGDFARRRVPCKHIYRLAMELLLIEGEFQTGRNKNAVSDEIFGLPLTAQEELYRICYKNIYAGQPCCILPRNSDGQALISSGFCQEEALSVDIIGAFPARDLKEVLFKSNLQGLPKITSQKKTFIKWLQDNEADALPCLTHQYYFLSLTKQTEEIKHTVYRRLAKVLHPNEPMDTMCFAIKFTGGTPDD